MTEEKTIKSILSEALSLHNKTIKEYAIQVSDWKERFEQIQKQKHKYQEEYRNIKKEVESCTQENNKLKGEIDSLRKIVDREHRSDKCAACNSFQHTIQTLKEVYENTLTQKDSHIKYLESRIKELEKSKSETKNQKNIPIEDSSLFSPDSTCKYSPRKSRQVNPEKGHVSANTNRKLLSPDQEDDVLEKTVLKLRLPYTKKRSRYSEDPSPEQKRLRFDHDDTELHQGDVNLDRKPVNKRKQDRPQVIVPETCDFDMDLIEDDEEEETCLEISRNGTSRNKDQGTSHILMKNGVNGKVPDNVKKNIISKRLEMMQKKGHRSVAMESSSSESEEGHASRDQVQGHKVKGHNKSWLHSVLKSPDSDINTRHEKIDKIHNSQLEKRKNCKNSHSQSESRMEIKSSLRKTKSDAECLLRKMTTTSGHVLDVDSQDETLLPVVPLKNRKISQKKEKSKNENESRLEKSVMKENNSDLLKSPSLFDGNTTPSRLPARYDKNQSQPGYNSQQPIDILSDNESPLILRTSARTDVEKPSFPEVDVLFEDSEESPKGKSLLQQDKSEKIVRKVKGRRSGSSRSQERSPELTRSPVLRDRSKMKSTKNILVPIYDQDEETRLRQTTLSQAFMNNKPDSELQLAIEQSLKETSKGTHKRRNKTNQDLIEAKENSPPFKKPLIPKMKNKKNKSDNNEKGFKSKPLPDIELDETIAPSRCINEIKGSNCELVQEKINGSLDPAIQLSQLCQDSQDVETENPLTTQKKAVDLHLNTLQDFDWEDLQGNTEMPKTSTCLELDDDSQGIPCSSTSVKFGSGKLKRQKRKLKTGDTENSEQEATHSRQIMDDSFDVRPKKPDPEYAYVDVVRGKDERRKLKAFWCQECADYYKDTGMSDEDIQKKMQTCSKHRATFAPPSTPEHFWSIGFMDTPECEERGYINKETSEEKKKPGFKRTRGYKQLFKSKKENEES